MERENARKSVMMTNSSTSSNLWENILLESMTQKDLEESNIFIFGDNNSGKRNLIKSINKTITNKTDLEERNYYKDEEGINRYSLVDFTFLDIKKLSEKDEEGIGKANVWIINDYLSK